MNSNIIEAEKIVKVYGHIKALRGVDLSVRKGSFISIFGPNGAGKTTLIKILTTLIKPTSGTLRISGMETSKAKRNELMKMIGLISHSTFLYDNLTGYENLRFYASMYGCTKGKDELNTLIDSVGLHDRRDDPVRTYSRGMQQRLSIARGIVHDPEIVFLDEPFTGLDQHAARMLQNLLVSINAAGKTVIMVTHNLSRALEMSETVAIISKGSIVSHTAVEEIEPERFESIYLDAVGSPLDASGHE